MARLFIFAIGGTGSRVLKSFTMLLASGIKPRVDKEYEIVTIIIDPHKSNEDLKRTVRLLENYQSITGAVGTDNGFFATRLTTLNHLSNRANKLSSNFTLSLQQVAQTRFKDYIQFDQLNENSKALTDILFSGKSIDKHGEPTDLLNIEMDIGFVGNPNIGSVVLNQFKDSEEFQEVAAQYKPEDRIFIISSIFGGTGAAGFPTILKNIRNAMKNPHINSKGLLENARIGAITVLPYFNLENSAESPIQKSDFIGKTKAALSYYLDNVNHSVNALYYLADDFTGQPYKNDPGDDGQKNDAHFIELAAALAIVNFLEIPDDDLNSSEGRVLNPIYREFSIKSDTASIHFSDLEIGTADILSKKLSQFTLFRKYLSEEIQNSVEKQAWSIAAPIINQRFIHEPFYRSKLIEFFDAYGDWLTEMQKNSRGFAPFVLTAALDAVICDIKPKSGFLVSRPDMNTLENILSKTVKGKTYTSAEQKLIRLFFDGTEELLTSKFGFK